MGYAGRRRLDLQRPAERQIILYPILSQQAPNRLALGCGKQRRKARRPRPNLLRERETSFYRTVSANPARGNAQGHRIWLHLPLAKIPRSMRSQSRAKHANSGLNLRKRLD
jgi:hypothetical protein